MALFWAPFNARQMVTCDLFCGHGSKLGTTIPWWLILKWIKMDQTCDSLDFGYCPIPKCMYGNTGMSYIIHFGVLHLLPMHTVVDSTCLLVDGFYRIGTKNMGFSARKHEGLICKMETRSRNDGRLMFPWVCAIILQGFLDDDSWLCKSINYGNAYQPYQPTSRTNLPRCFVSWFKWL